MILKTFITLLTVATLFLFFAGIGGYMRPIGWHTSFERTPSAELVQRNIQNIIDDLTLRSVNGRFVITLDETLVLSRVKMAGPSDWPRRRTIEFSRFGVAFMLDQFFHTWAVVSVNVWYPIALFGAYPIWAFVRGPARRWRRRKRNLCTACAYDLTGLESDRCPECGTST